MAVRGDGVWDISKLAPTVRDLAESGDAVAMLREGKGERIGALEDILANTPEAQRDAKKPWLLAPIDLQAIKAAGVTFPLSMLERVIEEQARGSPEKAEAIRSSVQAHLGGDLAKLVPGSKEAAELKRVLIEQGAWSQYLEVGIGPDAEIFTKAQPMAAVGHGMEAGLHPISSWNNPEPEVVLVVNSKGAIVGATLGNDVNLRDVEGRSALLLSKAKDNNASTAIGPFVRFFDGAFTLDTVRRIEVSLTVEGEDGFTLEGRSSMAAIARDPADLVAADARAASPVSRRRRAVPRHHVCAGEGPRRQGPGLHAQGRRRDDHLGAGAGRARQPHDAVHGGAAVGVRGRGADAQPCPPRLAVSLRSPSPRLRGEGLVRAAAIQRWSVLPLTLTLPTK